MLCLTSLLASTLLAAAEPPPPPEEAAPAVGSGFVVSLGVDRRKFDTYFYYYGSAYGSGFSETESSVYAVAGEVGYELAVNSSLSVTPGLGLSLGVADIWYGDTNNYPPGIETSGVGIHAELFGEAAARMGARLTGLARLAVGHTIVTQDLAADDTTNVFVAVGARYSLSDRVSIGALGQFKVANLGGYSDAGITSSEPTLESHTNWAIQARVRFRL